MKVHKIEYVMARNRLQDPDPPREANDAPQTF